MCVKVHRESGKTGVVGAAALVAGIATIMPGKDNVVFDLVPSMDAEEFLFISQIEPGAYIQLGTGWC